MINKLLLLALLHRVTLNMKINFILRVLRISLCVRWWNSGVLLNIESTIDKIFHFTEQFDIWPPQDHNNLHTVALCGGIWGCYTELLPCCPAMLLLGQNTACMFLFWPLLPYLNPNKRLATLFFCTRQETLLIPTVVTAAQGNTHGRKTLNWTGMIKKKKMLHQRAKVT